MAGLEVLSLCAQDDVKYLECIDFLYKPVLQKSVNNTEAARSVIKTYTYYSLR